MDGLCASVAWLGTTVHGFGTSVSGPESTAVGLGIDSSRGGLGKLTVEIGVSVAGLVRTVAGTRTSVAGLGTSIAGLGLSVTEAETTAVGLVASVAGPET